MPSRSDRHEQHQQGANEGACGVGDNVAPRGDALRQEDHLGQLHSPGQGRGEDNRQKPPAAVQTQGQNDAEKG